MLATVACFPAISHPTRVSSGFSVSTTLGMHIAKNIVLTQGVHDTKSYPAFGLTAALSARDTSAGDEGIGVRLAVGTGFSQPIWQAYIELPRERFGALDAGTGVAVHGAGPRLVMPYVQVGKEFGPNRFWYTQQGLAFGSTSDGVASGPIWMPTVAIASGVAGGEASMFVTGVIGGHSLVFQEICRNCADDPRRVTRSLLLVGVSWGQIVISNLPIPRSR
jgi:hypothetical protein